MSDKHPVELVMDRIEKWFWAFVWAAFGSVAFVVILFAFAVLMHNLNK